MELSKGISDPPSWLEVRWHVMFFYDTTILLFYLSHLLLKNVSLLVDKASTVLGQYCRRLDTLTHLRLQRLYFRSNGVRLPVKSTP